MSEKNFVLEVMENRTKDSRWALVNVKSSRKIKHPTFSTVNPQIVEIKENYCEIKIKKRRSVENHIGTVHVIAICNQLEMCYGCFSRSIYTKSSCAGYLRAWK